MADDTSKPCLMACFEDGQSYVAMDLGHWCDVTFSSLWRPQVQGVSSVQSY